MVQSRATTSTRRHHEVGGHEGYPGVKLVRTATSTKPRLVVNTSGQTSAGKKVRSEEAGVELAKT